MSDRPEDAIATELIPRREFAFVAAGAHTITVLRETLPLPWVLAQDKPISVEVLVRDQLRLSIGAVRSSE